MLTDAVLAEWEKRQQHTEKKKKTIAERIVDLKAELRQTPKSEVTNIGDSNKIYGGRFNAYRNTDTAARVRQESHSRCRHE